MAISAKQKQLRDQLTDKLVAAALDKAEAQRALAAADLKIAKLKKDLDALDVIEGRDS